MKKTCYKGKFRVAYQNNSEKQVQMFAIDLFSISN